MDTSNSTPEEIFATVWTGLQPRVKYLRGMKPLRRFAMPHNQENRQQFYGPLDGVNDSIPVIEIGRFGLRYHNPNTGLLNHIGNSWIRVYIDRYGHWLFWYEVGTIHAGWMIARDSKPETILAALSASIPPNCTIDQRFEEQPRPLKLARCLTTSFQKSVEKKASDVSEERTRIDELTVLAPPYVYH